MYAHDTESRHDILTPEASREFFLVPRTSLEKDLAQAEAEVEDLKKKEDGEERKPKKLDVDPTKLKVDVRFQNLSGPRTFELLLNGLRNNEVCFHFGKIVLGKLLESPEIFA